MKTPRLPARLTRSKHTLSALKTLFSLGPAMVTSTSPSWPSFGSTVTKKTPVTSLMFIALQPFGPTMEPPAADGTRSVVVT